MARNDYERVCAAFGEHLHWKRVINHSFLMFARRGDLPSDEVDILAKLGESPWKEVAEADQVMYHLHTVATFYGICEQMPALIESPAGPLKQPITSCPTLADFEEEKYHLLPSLLYSYLRACSPSWFIVQHFQQVRDRKDLDYVLYRKCVGWAKQRPAIWEAAGASIIRDPRECLLRERKKRDVIAALDSLKWGDEVVSIEKQYQKDTEEFRGELQTLLSRIAEDQPFKEGRYAKFASEEAAQLYKSRQSRADLSCAIRDLSDDFWRGFRGITSRITEMGDEDFKILREAVWAASETKKATTREEQEQMTILRNLKAAKEAIEAQIKAQEQKLEFDRRAAQQATLKECKNLPFPKRW